MMKNEEMFADISFKLENGFWEVTSIRNDRNENSGSCTTIRTHQYKFKRLAQRRNHVMNLIKYLPISSQSGPMEKLKIFDAVFGELLGKLDKNVYNFEHRMLFKKTDYDVVDYLYKSLGNIHEMFSMQSTGDDEIKTCESSQDIYNDFLIDLEIFKSSVENISFLDILEIKSNFMELKVIVKNSAEFITSFDSSINLLYGVKVALKEVEVILEERTILPSVYIPDAQAQCCQSPPPTSLLNYDKPIENSVTAPSSTSITLSLSTETDNTESTTRTNSFSKMEECIQYWSSWISSHVANIQPAKLLAYAATFYNEDVENEDTLERRLMKNMNWLIEHHFLKHDADEIIKYFDCIGKLSTQVSLLNRLNIEAAVQRQHAPVEWSKGFIDSCRSGNINELHTLTKSFDLRNIINLFDQQDWKSLMNISWNGYKGSALMWSSYNGQEDVVSLLIEEGADVNLKNSNGDTALSIACGNDHESIAKLLIIKGALINRKDKCGTTALMIACRHDRSAVVRLLIENGADINLADKNGNTALVIACRYGVNTTLVTMLIENGADLNIKENSGNTAIMMASYSKQKEIACLLIEKGADVNLTDNVSKTLLMIASGLGQESVVKLLLEKRTSINARDKSGSTALLRAIHKNQVAIAILLINSSADFNIVDNNGNTPLIIASGSGQFEVVQLLIDKGVRINLKDDCGNTALTIASRYGREAIIKLLIQNGAK